MSLKLRIAVIGRRDDSRPSHRAITRAIEMACGKLPCNIQWIDPKGVDSAALAGFDAFWFAPGSVATDQPDLSRAMSVLRKRARPTLFTGSAAHYALADYAKVGFKMRWKVPVLPESTDRAVTADLFTPLQCIYRKRIIPAPALIAVAMDGQMDQRLFGPAAPFTVHAKDADGRIGAFGPPFLTSLSEAVFFEPERDALDGRLPPLAKRLIAAARSHLRHPLEQRGFFLFDDSWCFFRQSPVRAVINRKVGSVFYQGGFGVLKRPAMRVPFLDTDGVASQLEDAVTPREERSISLKQYELLKSKGNPLFLEFDVRDFAQLARRSYSLWIAQYHNRIEVSMSPWTSGGRVGGVDWQRTILVSRDATGQEQKRAFRRAALALQTQYPPLGYEFKPGKGLVKEDLTKYMRKRSGKL